MSSKESFIFYYDWMEYLKMLNDPALAFEVAEAVVNFAKNGQATTFDEPAANMAYTLMCKQVERDSDKYSKTVEKRREAGKKGGRPKGQDSSEKASDNSEKQKKQMLSEKPNASFQKQMKAKKADNVPVNVPVPVPVNDPVPDPDPVPVPDNVPGLYAAAASDSLPSVENSVKNKGKGKRTESDSLDKQLDNIVYFQQRYKARKGKDHPPLKPAEAMRIAQCMDRYDDCREMIDAYFGDAEHKGLCGDSDCSIRHFASDGVQRMLYRRTYQTPYEGIP